MRLLKRSPLTVWVFALFIALLTTLPHIIALMNTPQGWQYSGALPVPAGFRVDFAAFPQKPKAFKGNVPGALETHLARLRQGDCAGWINKRVGID